MKIRRQKFIDELPIKVSQVFPLFYFPPSHISTVFHYRCRIFQNHINMSDVESTTSDQIGKAINEVMKEAQEVKTRPKSKDGKGKEPVKKKPKVQRAKDPLIKIVEDKDDNCCFVHEDDISTLRSMSSTRKNDTMIFTINFTEAKPVSFSVPLQDASDVRKKIQKLRRDRLPIIETDHVESAADDEDFDDKSSSQKSVTKKHHRSSSSSSTKEEPKRKRTEAEESDGDVEF